MEIKNKNQKKSKHKKPRRIKASEFAGTVKAFKDYNALAYQKSIRD